MLRHVNSGVGGGAACRGGLRNPRGLAAWAAITIPGLAGKHQAELAVVITAGITAAVCRTVTRSPLDYSKPPVPTPFGDLPLDLWRQLFRGPLLLAVLILVVVHIHWPTQR